MVPSPNDVMKLLADGLALVYHEARNARHLVTKGYLSSAGWEVLVSLPRDRDDAWKEIQDVRESAAAAPTVAKAIRGFNVRFGKSLEDLADLYSNQNWKHASAVGGHAWRDVTERVVQLGDAIVSQRPEQLQEAVGRILAARHNNGDVRDKIIRLDKALGVQTGSLWNDNSGAQLTP